MKWLAFALVLVGALAAVARSFPPLGGSAPAAAETVRVVRRNVGAAVKATGVVKPMDGAEVRVGSRLSGVVKRLHVRIGDVVEPGQVLAELDAAELAARSDQAAAALQSARAELQWARADLRRKRELAAARLLSAGDLDLAERAGAVAEARVAESEANLAYARIQVGWTRITAPISGTVASVSTQEGETVAASFAAPTFVTLLDLTRLEVRAYVDETDIGRIEPGQPARFTVDTWPDREFAGRVTSIRPQAEIRDNVVDYVVVVTIDPPADRTLRPEMTATVRIALETRSAALALPRRAIRRQGGRTFVACLRGKRAVRQPVTLGLQDDQGWEVVEGIVEGESILVGDLPADLAGEE